MLNTETGRKEHNLVREQVAFYDFTLETLEVTGKDAREFLDYILVNNVQDLKPGKALYTTMLDEDGYILDDFIMFAREEDKFWITTGMIDQLKDWLNQHVGDRDVQFEDITDEKAIYAVQGPLSKEVLNDILVENVDDIGSFSFKDTETQGGVELMVARTGFTGELGYELHFHPDQMEDVAQELKDEGVEEIFEEDVTLGSLSVEKGFLQDTDFLGTNTVEVGLGWTVRDNKDFIGKERTLDYKENGPARHLLGFALEEDANLEEGDIVELNGEEVGKVTSYTYGYTAEKYLGYALVDNKAEIGDEVTIKGKDGDVTTTLEKKEFV